MRRVWRALPAIIAAEQSQPMRNRRASRGRVAEWPVTDPILPGGYSLRLTRWPSGNPDGVRRIGAGAGRSDRTRSAAGTLTPTLSRREREIRVRQEPAIAAVQRRLQC